MYFASLLGSYSFRLYQKAKLAGRFFRLPKPNGLDRDFLKQSALEFSHSFQTPLTLIFAYLESLKQKQGTAPEITKIENLLNDISVKTYTFVDLAKLESWPNKIVRKKINLSELLLDVAEQVQIICAAKQIKFVYELAGGIFVNADAVVLTEAVNNLLGNAVKYISNNREIFLRLRFVKNIEIEIQDTGIGIPQACMSKIFERFYRVNPECKTPGVGLGLNIAKIIIEKHGGQLNVESREGVGSLFTIYLPK